MIRKSAKKLFHGFIILPCVLILISFSIDAQPNLVLNPSLENYITCPGFGQFSNIYINDWSKPSYGSTDYYNDSCPGIHATQQIPRTGIAYAGIICYNYGTEYREYMTGQLSSPLISGMTYSVEFYISLNDGYIQAIQEVGAYLSNTAPGPFANALHIAVVPQIENTLGILSDTSLWMQVSGNFVAAGGEQFITIGNFHDDTTTTIVQVGNIGSFGTYYFVDDVSISQIDPTSSFAGQPLINMVSVFPNPSTGKIFISAKNTSDKITSLKVSNVFGKTVSDFSIAEFKNNFSFDFSSSKGIYFLEIVFNDGQNFVQKIFVE